MRTIAAIMSIGACATAVLMAGGCGGPSPESSEPTVTLPATTLPATILPATTLPAAETGQGEPAPDTPAAPRAAQEWTMPDLVGANLQNAQDQIQALTGGAIFFTDSHDLGGGDRNQVLDANWKVCSQNVGPGAPVTSTAQIDFGVVKLDESCP